MSEKTQIQKLSLIQRHISIIEEELDFLSVQNANFSLEKENVNLFIRGQTICQQGMFSVLKYITNKIECSQTTFQFSENQNSINFETDSKMLKSFQNVKLVKVSEEFSQENAFKSDQKNNAELISQNEKNKKFKKNLAMEFYQQNQQKQFQTNSIFIDQQAQEINETQNHDNTAKKIKRGPYNKVSMEIKRKAVQLSNMLKDPVSAARIYNLPLKSLKRWVRIGYQRKKGGRRTQDPDMEDVLMDWISKFYQLNNKMPESRLIKKMAMQFSNFPGRFKASKGWFENFALRQNLKEEFKQPLEEIQAEPYVMQNEALLIYKALQSASQNKQNQNSQEQSILIAI